MKSRHRVTVILNEVDIFGNAPLRATVNRTTHVVVRRGATSRSREIEHGPDSRHVFLPRDGVDKKDVNRTLVPRLMAVLLTVKPGVTETD